MEQPNFNAAEYFKKKLGLSEQSEQEQKEVKLSMTTGRMEELRESLEDMNLETFLNIRMPAYTYEKEKLEKAQNLIKEFLSAKEGLDSNSKEKLYKDIFEKNWKPKLEEAFDDLNSELDNLELVKKSNKMERGEPAVLKEGDELLLKDSEYTALMDNLTIKERVRRLTVGLEALNSFGFDKQRLDELEGRLKKVKK